jgi:NitT/TauT family transport system substrate-binding protein
MTNTTKTIRRKAAVAAATLLAITPALAACGHSNSDGTPTVKLMVGGIDKQIYLPYKLADDLGYYKKYGVNVELSTEQNGGVGAEDAMISGQVDMAGAWYIHTIDFQVAGKGVESVAQLSGAPGEREMCATGSGVHAGADFAGKTFGVTDLGSGTDTLTKLIASEGGVGLSDIHRIAVGDGDTAVAALEKHSASCVMTTQPTVTAIEKRHAGYPAINLASTAGAQQALGGAWPAACVLARTDWVNSNKDTVQRVVDALVATMHWIHTHTAAQIADKLPASYVSNPLISKSEYIQGLDADKAQFLPDGIMPAGGPETVLKTEKLVGVDTSDVDLSTTFTNEFALKANKDEGFPLTTKPEGGQG